MSVTRLPPVETSPAVAVSRPATSESIVLLPQPEAPIRQTNSPGCTASDTLSSASSDDRPFP